MMKTLSESALRAACGKRVWERAEELLHWPALHLVSACGEGRAWELFGRCHGSQGELYALRVQVSGEALGETSCSCAFDGRGLCKHRVALALLWARHEDKFRVLPPLATMVAACSPETLADLVAAMVRRSPEFLSLLGASRGGDEEEEPVRETLRRALSGRDADDGAPVLERVFGQANQLEAGGEWAKAGALWSVAIEELSHAAAGFEQIYEREVERMEGYHDEESNFGTGWAHSAVEGLGRAFEAEVAPETRREWARSLWEAERAARDCEYFALPDQVRELLARWADEQLWADIEATLRAALKAQPRRPNYAAHALGGGSFEIMHIPAGDDYKRGHDVAFLLSRLQLQGKTEEAAALIAELGTTRQQFELRLRARDFAGAAKLAEQSYASTPYQLLACATQLDEAGASEIALQLVLDARQNPSSHDEFLPSHRANEWGAWLCDFYLRSKRGAEARVEAVRLFAASPDTTQFARLKRAVELGGDWPSQRDSVEAEVRKLAGQRPLVGGSREGEVALSLALCEREAPRILALFEKEPPKERPRFLEAVAGAIEAELPANALPLWCELAERTIENRHTGSARRVYAQAAAYLLRARALHQKLGSMDEWDDYLATLRMVHKALRALSDELQKAGL